MLNKKIGISCVSTCIYKTLEFNDIKQLLLLTKKIVEEFLSEQVPGYNSRDQT